MKSTALPIIAFAGLLAFAMSIPAARAQDSPPGQEMHESGVAAVEVFKDAGQSLKYAYRATRDEALDAALTTKVKTALLEDRTTRKFTIHVTSDQGTVTLTGSVESPAAAARAQSVASAVGGVEAVNNQLTWRTSAR